MNIHTRIMAVRLDPIETNRDYDIQWKDDSATITHDGTHAHVSWDFGGKQFSATRIFLVNEQILVAYRTPYAPFHVVDVYVNGDLRWGITIWESPEPSIVVVPSRGLLIVPRHSYGIVAGLVTGVIVDGTHKVKPDRQWPIPTGAATLRRWQWKLRMHV